jgi:hypothetical protein
MAERRRIEGNFDQGWPFAIFITALAIGLFALAGVIKKNTFQDPTDPIVHGSSPAANAERSEAH